MTVESILAERPSQHGEFVENSRATWAIMRVLQNERNWPTLTDPERHSLYMISHKMARIAAGNPKYPDHWDDIAGYAQMVSDRIREPVQPFDSHEIYATLARGWDISIDEARSRVARINETRKQDLTDQRRSAANGGAQTAEGSGSAEPSNLPGGVPSGRSYAANDRPGTPDDGGQHGLGSLEGLAEDLRRELKKDE